MACLQKYVRNRPKAAVFPKDFATHTETRLAWSNRRLHRKKIIAPIKFFPVSPDKDCKRPRDKLASQTNSQIKE
jgi:hypothetical protein